MAFAEAIVSATPYASESVSENNLYVLISCGVLQIQRSAYFMLSHLYKNFIPKIAFERDEESEIQQLQALAETEEE